MMGDHVTRQAIIGFALASGIGAMTISAEPNLPHACSTKAIVRGTSTTTSTISKIPWQPSSAEAREDLDSAEAIMLKGPPGPNQVDVSGNDDTRDYNDISAEDYIADSQETERSGRAELDMGALLILKGEYVQAKEHIDAAAAVKPNDAAVRAMLAKDRLGLRVISWTKYRLPHGQQVAKLVPILVTGRHYWAALSCIKRTYKALGSDVTRLKRPIISIVQEKHGRIALTFQYSVSSNGIEADGYTGISIFAFPMTGSKTPELVFSGVNTDDGNNCGRMQVYHWSRNVYRLVFDATNENEPLWIQDIKQNSTYQIRSATSIGSELKPGEQLHWVDVYAWNGKRFAEADSKFTEAFRATIKGIRSLLLTHPANIELNEYLGRAYLNEGRKHQALAVLQLAERLCKTELEIDPSDDNAKSSLKEIKQMLAHPGGPHCKVK